MSPQKFIYFRHALSTKNLGMGMLFKMHSPKNSLRNSKNHIFSRVHATLQPALSIGRSVGKLVSWSVIYDFHVFLFCDLTAPAQMI